jgi:imidazolonepropionase
MRQLGVVEDGSVLIVDGVIQRVGPTRQVENLAEARSAEEINATGQVVMPGFVDCHTHLIAPPARMALTRDDGTSPAVTPGSSGFAPAVQWVRNAAPRTLEFNARRHLEAALRHGTTSVEAKSGYALNGSGELKILRVLAGLGDSTVSLVTTFCGAQGKSPEFSKSAEYIDWLCRWLIPKLRERKAARYVDALCDRSGFTPEELRPYLTAAAAAGFPLRLHGDYTAHTGCVPLALAHSAVAVGGLNHISESDIRMLARSATIATLLPARSHGSDANRYAPGRALLDAGAAVALATGFHPSAISTFNMQTVIALACSAMSFTTEEAISAATINASCALGLGMVCGTLESGRQADLLMLNVSDYRELGLFCGVNVVRLVIRRGEVVYREAPLACDKS